MPVADVIASEDEVRTSSLRIQLPHLAALLTPVTRSFLTGDFNEPSSLDYTDQTVGAHEGVTEPVPWPVSEALFGIGFTDTFRAIHPDPVADPGITWGNWRSPERTPRATASTTCTPAGPFTTRDSKLVGKRRQRQRRIGLRYVDVGPPSGAVDTRPQTGRAADDSVARRRMLTQGEDVTVYVNAPGSAETTVALVPAGADPSEAVVTQQVEGASGTLTFDSGDLTPSGYDMVMVDASAKELARNQFWVRGKDAQVSISTDRATYDVGQPITVTWDHGPANRWDWIGVYRASAADPRQGQLPALGLHRGARLRSSPTVGERFDDSGRGPHRASPGRCPAGSYVVHYLLTDQYESAGRAEFTVT